MPLMGESPAVFGVAQPQLMNKNNAPSAMRQTEHKKVASWFYSPLTIFYLLFLAKHFSNPLKETFISFLRLGLKILTLLQFFQHGFFFGC